MKTCNTSSHLLLQLLYITVFSAFEAQHVEVLPEVIGYLGYDVTLPCQFIQGPNYTNITQVQWAAQQPAGTATNEGVIIVLSKQFGLSIRNSSLKERVKLEEQSLIIKDIEKADAGSYTCSIVTFPSGSFEKTTKLIVQEKMTLSTGMISAIVIAVMLLFVIMAAMIYLIFIRRRCSSVRRSIIIDTTGSTRGIARPSVIVRDEDVVYSDIKLKPSRDTSPSFSEKHRDTAHADDVTYSEVVVSHWQSK